MDHIYNFETDRLLFLPLSWKDLEMIREWRNQNHIRINFIDQNIIETEQQNKWFGNYLKNENDIMFVAFEKKQHIPIGSAGLYRINRIYKTAEFGRLMIGSKQFSGNGYGTEIVKGICNFAGEELGLTTIYLQVLDGNENAKHIYQKIGFKVTGINVESGLDLIQMELSFKVP
ncbi:GNAT family N-acetyltransferase [Paenibacillus alkaliterrae]|uniref:GNAT family N-acetyltransferase n=1 Tax=Paenibacillus alkaliterrae TaxID=320909 RepID=UPI001F18DAB1|nr:GNAT family N-acetyltransferase [Paenibacillus alkaliterrae]MCF2940395.1 GNAT family N-acetyltransferase [Paenibacillus alkaliterrae]